MTLPHGTDRLESDRLVLRRIAPDDLPFFIRIHALPESRSIFIPEAGRLIVKKLTTVAGAPGAAGV